MEMVLEHLRRSIVLVNVDVMSTVLRVDSIFVPYTSRGYHSSPSRETTLQAKGELC